MARALVLVLFVLMALGAAAPARAQAPDYGIPDIMKPEPWLAPKYKSPRGARERPVAPKPPPEARPRAEAPPPIYVPQTGRLLPNLPTVSPSGPGGRETYQDRAARCHHQAGVYGDQAGDRTGYIGSCINQ
ncbi:MAG: hypothetical protein ACK4UO_11000 [Pseudolabrys sp.]